MDIVDACNLEIKRKFVPEFPTQLILTPQLQFRTPNVTKTLKPFASVKTGEANQNQSVPNQLAVCNSFVYATCRDALNGIIFIERKS